MDYTLDTNGARAADQRGGFINETGKYIGTFMRAEDITSKSGTHGIEFDFKAADGRKARFSLYTAKADGARIKIGHSFVMAMMTCLKQRELKTQEMMVKKWDNDRGAEVDARASCYPGLMAKPIGVLLEAEEYEKNSGEIGKRMVLAGVFDAATELTASEILDKKVAPEQLSKIVAQLRDRPLKAGRKSSGGGGSDPRGSDYDNTDDDIPFN